MRQFAGRRALDVWYARLHVEDLAEHWGAQATANQRKRFERNVAKARAKDSMRGSDRLAHVVRCSRSSRTPRRRSSAIVADPWTWKAWFPGITGGSYASAGDHGVGATRFLRVADTRVRETMLVYEEPRRWIYRVDATSIPIARAMVETWRFDELPYRTHVRWTLAIDPLPQTALAAIRGRGMRDLSIYSTRPNPADLRVPLASALLFPRHVENARQVSIGWRARRHRTRQRSR